jgi:hypothetical protein
MALWAGAAAPATVAKACVTAPTTGATEPVTGSEAPAVASVAGAAAPLTGAFGAVDTAEVTTPVTGATS